MSRPRTVEQQLLTKADLRINAFSRPFEDRAHEARVQVLETVASLISGFSIDDYHSAFGVAALIGYDSLVRKAREVLDDIQETPVPLPLALSALAREPLTELAQRNLGSYPTDFRLAMRLAQMALPALSDESRVIDPACGSGMLLAALTTSFCRSDRGKAAAWLANGVFAADLSESAIRHTVLSLACFTSSIELLQLLRRRFRNEDSLLSSVESWRALAPVGFDLVIANPPWEKLKLTRHEFLQGSGLSRHYGEKYSEINPDVFNRALNELSSYVERLLLRYPNLTAEPDLYMAFLELFFELVKPSGQIALLVPAGLIRSQRTTQLREQLFRRAQHLTIAVLDNRASFFNIDTRFKFLAVACELLPQRSPKRTPVSLLHEKGTSTGVREYGRARIPRAPLRNLRPDLTIPEVRSDREWRLFQSMSSAGTSWNSAAGQWTPHLMREVDMTKGRPLFHSAPQKGSVPVVEGRMIQQHRFGAKRYVEGSGRRAIWRNNPLGRSQVSPQFWIDVAHLASPVQARIENPRIGFCDITGQTNERSLMAAIVPAGVVCGNKVPTIVFPDDPSEERLLLCTAILNSLPFDWLLRRVVTTTVNYFLLLSLPLPPIAKDSLPGRHLIAAARQLRVFDEKPQSFVDSWAVAQLRAQIDVAVSVAYGLKFSDIELLLDDFPLIDQAQPALEGEQASTVTRDLLLLNAARRVDAVQRRLSKRISAAEAVGAIPYVPSEIAFESPDRTAADYA